MGHPHRRHPRHHRSHRHPPPTHQQRDRAQAWQRISWCLELTTSDDDAAAELGWTMYSTVSKSKLITPTEHDVIRTVSEHAMRRALAQDPDTEDTEPQTDTTEDPR